MTLLFCYISIIEGGLMSEVNLVYQMYNTLSKSDKMRFMQMLGMPPQMTEIIDSSTMEEFLGKVERFTLASVYIHKLCSNHY